MAYIDAIDAAEILGCDSSTVRKYANRGLLRTKKSGKKLLFNKAKVNDLKVGRDTRRDLGDSVKEIFVLLRESATKKFLAKIYSVGQGDLENALMWYTHEREMYIGKGTPNNEDILLTGEVAARLRIISKHPVYSLIEEGRLKAYPASNGNRFVSLKSLISYLGPRARHPLYTSREALELLMRNGRGGITIADIDTVASHNEIGMKIQEKRMSSYRFTLQEIYDLKRHL